MEEQTQDAKKIFNAASVYRQAGQFLHKRDKIDEAKQAYDQAYKNAVDDINVLIDRSCLYTDAFHHQQALKDAEQALTIDPKNLRALKASAAAYKLMTEFEKSITLNSRGLKRREQPSYFREGFNQGIAILNQTIGKNAGDVMKHYLPIIKEHGDILDNMSTKPALYALNSKKHVCRIPSAKRVVARNPLEIHRKALLSRVLAYKYLEPLAYDKFFLQDLVEDPRLESASKESSRKIKELAAKALQTLIERQNMLHAQCPYYTIQQTQTVSKRQNKFKKKLLENEREMNVRQGRVYLRNIEACSAENRINDMMRMVKNMQKFLDTKTNYNFPDKDYYIDRLYSIVGRGILSQYRLSYSHNYQKSHSRVSFLMGLKPTRPASYDSVIRNYPQRFGEPKTALQNALHALEEAENPNMRCWLHYEISQLQRALRNYPLSYYHAQICQKEAEKAGKHVWWLNGCFSLISSDVHQGDMNDVVNLATEAYKWAKKEGKEAEIQQFLLHCVELAKEVAEYDAFDIEKRKKDILKVMCDENTARETSLLFDRMSRVPLHRQMSLFPKNEPKKSMDMQSKCFE
ncbi:hypothetical protein NE865_09378 [Phthorimaea operculella]|nr:hypothetical protein NE865_09378 [Phthorimaea operculella]